MNFMLAGALQKTAPGLQADEPVMAYTPNRLIFRTRSARLCKVSPII